MSLLGYVCLAVICDTGSLSRKEDYHFWKDFGGMYGAPETLPLLPQTVPSTDDHLVKDLFIFN
jgi:hypothetical protein